MITSGFGEIQGVRVFFTCAFVVYFGYFLLLLAYYSLLGVISFFEDRRRARESAEEMYDELFTTHFTMPVSVIIPAHNEEAWIADSVGSVLRLKYPEIEVIVVDDGSTDKTLSILKDKLDLKAYDRTYIREFKDGRVREIFRSGIYPNVTVISKESGRKKAGAINAGLNIAKFKYICIIDADTVIEPDAMLKVMAHVHRDPDRIIGAGSYFGISDGFNIKDGVVVERIFSKRPILAYQNLEYIRSLIGNRIGWSRMNAMPIVAGGFALWRRDVVHEMGGYDPAFTCEDVEYTFRAHEYAAKHKKKDCRIEMLPYISGWTDGPSDIRSLILQRNRWQRVTDETVWRYRHMAFNPKYGAFGMFTFPYFVLYEALGVFFEVSSIIVMALGAALGVFDLGIFLAYFIMMTLSQTIVSIISLLSFMQVQKMVSARFIVYLIALSFLESFWYRWILSYAKIAGTIDFLSGNRAHTMYKRKRAAD